MKFDVEIPSLNGIARLEIKTVQEENRWVSYLSLFSERILNETCLMLGHSGIPHRFTGATEKDVEEAAKNFLQQNYHVVRMIW
ncbi:MAG: hypothetical protein ACE5JU_03780 [Candidatus Binatia bacterium]